MFNLARQWSSRPSELAGLRSGSYEGFCFDQAVSLVGTSIEGQLDAIEMGKGKNAAKARQAKQEILLKKLLFGDKVKMTKAFRDPAEAFNKRR
jgi:hypothetical protein